MTEQKNQIQDEIAKRGSHFTLGNSNVNPFVSTMKNDFRNGQDQKNRSQDDTLQKPQLQGTHFHLGKYKNKNFYVSNYKTLYPEHRGFLTNQLDQEQIKDLRSHHFNFGQFAQEKSTHSQRIYQKYPVQYNFQKLEEQISKMRVNHHDFAEQTQIYMQSKYNEEFNKVYGEQQGNQINKADLQQRVKELRSSHIQFGNDPQKIVTIHQSEFYKKDQNDKLNQLHSTKAFQQTNIHMGDQQNDFKTINNQYFDSKLLSQAEVAKLSEEKKNDLRISHFALGALGNNFQSEAQAQFQQKSNQQNQNADLIDINMKKRDNISLAHANCKSSYMSVYKQNMNEKKYEPLQQTDPQRKFKSNFQVGNMNLQMQSEFKENYTKPLEDYTKSGMTAEVQSNLKRSHFAFEDTKKYQFTSTQKASYLDPIEKQKQVVTQEGAGGSQYGNLLRNQRNTHFILGQNQHPYKTTNQSTYIQLQAEPAQFDKQKLESLRRTHFNLS